MKKFKNKWPKSTSAQNVLFAVKCIDEMLDDETWDSFKVYTLGTIDRFRDVIVVARKIDDKVIGHASIDAVIDEALWSLENDPISSCILGDETNHIISEVRKNSKDTRFLSHHFKYLINRIRPKYKKICENLIIEMCFTVKPKKTQLRQLCACYCSHIINTGYTKEFVRKTLTDEFIVNDVKRVDSRKLKKFFENFNEETRDYEVFIKFENRLFVQNINNIHTVSIFDKESELLQQRKIPKSSFTKINKKQSILSIIIRDELEPFSARNIANFYINIFKSLWHVLAIEAKPSSKKPVYVRVAGSRKGQLLPPERTPLQQRRNSSETPTDGELSKLATIFLGKQMETESRVRVVQSINTYSLAFNSTSQENQLVSIWSAFEALLPDPRENEVRIKHFIKYLVPGICHHYIRRMIEAVYSDLLKCFGGAFVRQLNQCPIGTTDFEKFSAIVTLQVAPQLKTSLLKTVSDDPLALFKLYQLNKKLSNPKNVEKLLLDHSLRVEWQLQRIYRARNDIVHSGNTVNNINGLICNIDDYYRNYFSTLVPALEKYSNNVSIDQLCSHLRIEYQKTCREIKINQSKDNTSEDLLMSLIR